VAGANNKPRSPRRWALPQPIIDVSPPKRSDICVVSLLSTNSREEQASAPSNHPSDLHNASSLSHELNSALSTNLIETSGGATKALSVDARTFQPRPKLNVNAPVFDPFGNIVNHDSPQSTHELHKWKDILINDGILIDNEPKIPHEAIGLTVDTSAGWSAEEKINPSKYIPTTPYHFCPKSPYNQMELNVSPASDGYSQAILVR
jgi:hypothetical protein